MKRFLAIILAALMLLSSAAYAGKDEGVLKSGTLELGSTGGYIERLNETILASLNQKIEHTNYNNLSNKQWFVQRTSDHRDDLELFIFHELRHIHQQYSIALCDRGQKINDDATTIELWRTGFQNYIRNTDAATESENVVQEIEIDANAYALCLVNLLHIDDDMELRFSIPEMAAEMAFERSKHYYDSKPELKRFLDKKRAIQRSAQNRQNGNMPIRKGLKVGANDLCPCGSGEKFKKCCRGKGIYD